MLAKKLRKVIGKDKKITLDLSDMAPGEVEVIVLQKEGYVVGATQEVIELPRHRLGKILGTLQRGEIYEDAR
jgi:deoxycytidine triphosphate deaminase